MADEPASVAGGAAALDRGDWEAARAAFADALARDETAAALDGMARAQWWLADVEAAVSYRTRAFRAFRSNEDNDRAARIAFWLAREYRTVLGNSSAANGWYTQGRQLVEELPPGPAHGWLDLARADLALDPTTQVRYADSAYQTARRSDDLDLEIYAMAARGLGHINCGHVDRGVADLDAALAAATGGSDLDTAGDTLCILMLAAEVVGDVSRFAQWNAVLDTYVAANHHLNLTGFCHTCCGEVFVIGGQWDKADMEFRAAIATMEQTGHRSRCAHPVTRLAKLRLRQGRLDEAEAMLAEFHDLPEAVEPLAALRLATGQAAAAARLIERRLAQIGEATLPAVPLLALLVEAYVGLGRIDDARSAAERLVELAGRSGLDRVRGLAMLANARIGRAEEHMDAARANLDGALDAFSGAAMPMEVAIVHRELAAMLADRDPEVAVEEGRAALHGFERLGAAREADETAAFLRGIGVRGVTGPKGLGLLTKREREVLELVAAGLTNAEIAARLYISTKTAGNHVSNLLAKLGVRSRTEAAATALRSAPVPR